MATVTREDQMVAWGQNYGARAADWGRDTVKELIDDVTSPLGLGISIGQMVTQDVPEATTRLARLQNMHARGYTRTMGR
ncbi:hypothetical protein ACWFRB_01765 [Rhodococcus sp. NPDC055112]